MSSPKKAAEEAQPSPVSRLPNDVLVEIFIRLPHARSATRCAAVCRQWRSVVNHPDFGPEFALRPAPSAHTTMLFMFDDRLFYQLFSDHSAVLHHGRPSRFFSDSFRYLSFLPWSYPRPLAASGDLLLATSRRSPLAEYCLCNPLTRRCLLLPDAPPRPDPADSLHGLGFSQGNFKAVRLDCSPLAGEYRHALTVFSSETGRWTRTPLSLPAMARPAALHAAEAVATSDGVLHFPVSLGDGGALAGTVSVDPFRGDGDSDSIRCRFVARPDRHAPPRLSPGPFLGTVMGRLRLATCGYVLRIWELDYGEGEGEGDPVWRVVHVGRLDRGGLIAAVAMRMASLSVIGFDPFNGDVVFLARGSSKICKYKLDDKECEVVGEIPSETLSKCLKADHAVYVRSLTLLHPSWPTPV